MYGLAYGPAGSENVRQETDHLLVTNRAAEIATRAFFVLDTAYST